MRPGVVMATLAVIVLGAESVAAQQMPERFTGVWQLTEQGAAPSCSAIDADIRIEVRHDTMEMPEGRCHYGNLTDGAGGVTLDLLCQEEGEEWSDRQEWRIGDAGGNEELLVAGITPGSEFEVVYGRCPASASFVEAYPPAQGLCYRQGLSELRITPVDSEKADVEIESAQGGAHICGLAGIASPIDGGFRYSERLDGAGECRLDIRLGADGGVTFTDADWICKQHYCGARATFEHITFEGSDREPC